MAWIFEVKFGDIMIELLNDLTYISRNAVFLLVVIFPQNEKNGNGQRRN